MSWVIDSSFACALFLPEEHSKRVKDFFDSIIEEGEIIVPSIWWYEIANVLTVAERRKRLSADSISEIITFFDHLEITTDDQEGAVYVRKIYELAKEHGLSSYDAGYLEAAIRNSASLASLDVDLQAAAKKMSVPLVKL